MLETTKNKLCLNSCFTKNSHEFSISDDVIVPDSKPDVDSILFVDCVPTIEDESVNSGQISISGTCDINILYSSDTEIQKIIRISTVIPFKTSFEVPSISADSNINVNMMPADISPSILNSRKISLNINLNTMVTSSNKNEIEYIENISDDNSTQMLHQSKNVPELLDYTTVKTNLRDTAMLPMSLPNIDDIVKYSTHILNEESVISDDKVIFKGDLCIKICYTSSDDNKICTFETTLPFSGFANLCNLTLSSKITTKSKVNSLSLKILPDSDDLMRVIEFDASISTNVMAQNNKSISLISDMYCTTHIVEPKIEKFSYNTCSDSMPEDVSLRGVINIPETENISIISSNGRVKELSLDEKDNKSLLTGTIELNIIYELPSNGNINSVSIDMPMEHLLNSTLNTIQNIVINNIEVSQAEIGKFDIKILLKITGEHITSEEIELLTDILETDEKVEKPASLTVYFTKPNDSFWKIAKKYNTTIDSICKMNNLTENDRLNNGQIIIV